MKNKFSKKKALELGSILLFMFGFTFFLNFFWEALHAVYLYQRHDIDASNYVPMLLYVSLMDGLIVSGLYFAVAGLWLNPFWAKAFLKKQILAFFLIGMATAAVIEYGSVFYFHRWSYKPAMPTLFGIGISPWLQLSITGLVAVWLTRGLLYGKGLLRR